MKKINAKIFEYTIELVIDDNITLVNGNSGIGKTLLFNYFDRQSYNSDKIYCFNAKFLEKIKGNSTVYTVFKKQLENIKSSLIVIDNADIIANQDIRQYIVYDDKNTYIMFGRNVEGLWITENNIASLIRDDKNKKIYLDYYFKDVNKK